MDILVDTKKCAKCGCEFVPAVEHSMREDGRYYCKPTCWMHRREVKKRKQGAWASLKKPVLHYNASGEVIAEYPSAKEATEALNLGKKTIFTLLKKGNPRRNGDYFRYKENNNAR